MLAAVTAIAALAIDYTGTLTVDGTSSQATVTVNNSGNNYTIVINNVSGIGNIEITAPGTTSNGLTSVITSQDIDAGNANLVLAFNQYAMAFNLDIVSDQGNTTNVKFAQDGELTGYQIKNSGFENFVESSGEPIAWHGFKSASGMLAYLAPGSLGSSDDCHSGSYSVVATSGSSWGVVGNGTFTTGRLNAASPQANNPANHSEMDKSSTATDNHNDLFYTVMNGRPDAMKFWFKFVPKTSTEKASVSAIITDGTYYQDPEDQTYTNKLATAKNTTIASTNTWTELSVPFTYIDKNIIGEALLVTFSTNAKPGGGKSGDQLFIDDVALVYNAAITGITVKGTALEGFSQDVHEYNFELANGETISEGDIDATFVSEHAYLVKKVVETDEAFKVFVAVISNDLNTVKVYTINYTSPVVEVTLDGVMFSNDRQWATWYGDKDLVLPENVTANVVTAINNNTVEIDNKVDYLPANVGLLLYSKTPASNITTQLYTGAKKQYTSKLQGSTNEQAVSNAYVLYNNQFILGQDGTTLAAHRCYLPVEGDVMNAPRMLMIGNDQGTVTAIDDLTTSGRRIEAVYNAQGQRVNENATGILIIRYSDGTTTKVIR